MRREQNGRGAVYTGNMRDPGSDETVLYLDSMNVIILVIILHCCFKDITTRETG